MKRMILYILPLFILLVVLQASPILAQQGCGGVKQVMFVFDVSGGMKTNERLAEAKKFALRTLQERALENLLYKVISYGGNCNDVVVEVDWTRDMTVLSAGIKGLYAGGATPLASSVDLAIDEIKKSAYPEETQVCLMNNSANSCGSVKEILDKRLPEIPCVHFYAIGLELDEQESSASIDKANADLQMLAERTNGRFAPLTDIRELTGVAMKDTGFAISPVQFVPRKKVRALTLTQDSKPRVGNADSTQRASQTLASNNQAQQQAKQEKSPQTSNDEQSSVKTDSAKQSPNSSPKESSTKESSAKETSTKETSTKETSAKETSAKETSVKETSSQAASSNASEKQPSSTLAVTNTAPNSNAKTNNSSKTTKKSESSQKGKSMKADNVVGQDTTPSSSEQSDAWQWKAVKQIEPKKQSTKKQSTKKSSTLAVKQSEKGTSTASNTQAPNTQAPSPQAPSPQAPSPQAPSTQAPNTQA
ncbi:MAG: hypothetical protein MUF71_11615, partial [Candidatus Kapabacteria bacterium]|nr:hypothetical protein [Candidatus Kapabacteria bacterium]